MYHTERLSAEIPVSEYVDNYVDVEKFLEFCRECRNYRAKWSCPPFDFDVYGYWKQYSRLHLEGTKIVFSREAREGDYSSQEQMGQINSILAREKQVLMDRLYGMEGEYPGSISLSAGSCTLCGGGLMGPGNCTRPGCPQGEGDASQLCRRYDKMRYSIEALGGDVGKTCSGLLQCELDWVEKGRLPGHLALVGGLLKK